MKNRALKLFDKIEEYSLYALLFFLPISKAAIEIFASFALFGFIGKKILRPDFRFLKTPENYLLASFMFFTGLSLFNSGPYLLKGVTALAFKWLEYTGLFFISLDAFSDRRRIKRALFIFMAMAAVVGVDGLSQRYLGIEFMRNRPIVDKLGQAAGFLAVRGPFDHYNGFGAYLVFVLAMYIALSLRQGFESSRRILIFIIISILSFSLLLTHSRAAFLSFLLALGLMFIFHPRRELIFYFLAVLILLLWFVPGIKERALFFLRFNKEDIRPQMWQATWLMIKENPFLGKGVGTFMDHFPRYFAYPYTQYAHNCYLQIWAETGLFSLVSFLAFLILILKGAIRAFKKTGELVLLGISCSIFAFLAHSFFDTLFYSLQFSVLFWVMAGIMRNMQGLAEGRLE